MQFGTRLRQERLRRHLSQEALAEAVGTSLKSISRWEQNQTVPQAYHRVRLSRFFGLRLEELFEQPEGQAPTSPLWGIPFPRNPCFTGREKLLQSLHAQLTTEHTIALTQTSALSGLGGVGKTQGSIEYAYRYAQEYSAIFWISAETTENILSSLLYIAELLQLPEREEADQQKVVAAVQRWLATHNRWLLIWDNLEEPDLLQRFLPPSRQGANLITTRCQALGTLAQGIDLPPMEHEEGMLFVLRRAKILEPHATGEQMQQLAASMPSEYAAAAELVKIMGGLPLALDQAGAYVEETGCNLAAYLQRYEQQRVHLLERRGGPGGTHLHPHSATTTFVLAKEQIEHINKAAADLLYVCAFLHAEAIPEELFVAGAVHLGPQLEPMATNPFQFDQATATLRSLSLIQRHPETHTFSLHRLVQAVLQEEMQEQERTMWLERTIAALNAIFPEDVSVKWKYCARLLPHVLAVADAMPDDSTNPALAEALQKAADHLRERTLYTQAEALYQRSLRTWKQGPGSSSDCPKVALVFNGLALLSYEYGKYEQAEALYQQVLRIQEHVWGSEHIQVARSLHNLALVISMQGRYAEAELLYKRALHIRKQAHEPESARTGIILNNIADMYLKQGKYEQVESLCEQALRILKQALGSEHALVAYPLVNLAMLYTEQKKYEQAEVFYQQALRNWEQALEMVHPLMAEGLNGLAGLYTRQGKYEQAESLHQRALHIQERAWGAEHPEVAATLHGLAAVYLKQGRNEEARAFYQRALTLRERYLGQHHPDTAQTLHDLAHFYWKRGNVCEAMSLAERALTIFSASLGDAHPKTAAAYTLHTILQDIAKSRNELQEKI